MTRNLKKKLRRYGFIGMLVAMAASVGMFLDKGPLSDPRSADAAKADRHEAPQSARANEPFTAPPGDWIGALGVIEPASPVVSLGPDTAGRIAKIHFKIGDMVETGDVIVELDSAVEIASLQAAEADVQAAEAELARTRRGRPLDIEAAESDLIEADSRALMSKNTYNRLTLAAQGDGATADEVDRARLTAKADAAKVRRAKAKRNASRGNRFEDVDAAKARLAAAKAKRDKSAALLDRMRIVSPISGKILDLANHVGEYVSPGGSAVVELGDTSLMRARLDLDERDVGQVVVGTQAIVAIDGQADRRYEAIVVEIGQMMGPRNAAAAINTDRDDIVVLDVVVALKSATQVVTGQRVVAFLEKTAPLGN